MWRFLYRRQSRLVRPRYVAAPFAILTLVTFGFSFDPGHEAAAQEEQLTIAGKTDHPITIREHAGWNRSCAAITPPALYLSEPPRHGRVCARSESIKISSMYIGTVSQCVGRLVEGVQLIYRPDATYAGDDGLRYAVQYPSVLRTIAVKVTVTAYSSSVPDAVPSNVIAPVAQARQAPGLVPVCADPVTGCQACALPRPRRRFCFPRRAC